MSSASAVADMHRPYELLTALNTGGAGSLRLYRPFPTAAFAPRDTTLPPYAEAAAAAARLGFAALERRAGGQLAVYDQNAIVIDLVSPHEDPRQHVMERFTAFSEAIGAALRGFGIDARVGEIDGEYCPGDYSVNARGAVKLVGVAQRIGRRAYHLGAVISVTPSPEAREAVTEAYRILGFPFEAATFGSIAGEVSGVTFPALRGALLEGLSRLLPVAR